MREGGHGGWRVGYGMGRGGSGHADCQAAGGHCDGQDDELAAVEEMFHRSEPFSAVGWAARLARPLSGSGYGAQPGSCAQGTAEAVPGPFAGLGYPGLGGQRWQRRPEVAGLVWPCTAGGAGRGIALGLVTQVSQALLVTVLALQLPLADRCLHLPVVLAGELAGQVGVCEHGFFLPVGGWPASPASPGKAHPPACSGGSGRLTPFRAVAAAGVELPTGAAGWCRAGAG